MSEANATPIYSARQPKGLYLLFSTELWERFGFYTIQAILILYMTKALGYADTKANLTYATYSSLLYITPVLGGYLADRFFGFRRSIILGGVFSAIGYFVLALPSQTYFFLGLSILICANGLFKPSVSSIVGDLYDVNDPRRDGGFTIFYMGINIGALIPPLIAEPLANRFGWHSGFLLAAGGMVLALIIFSFTKRRLADIGKIPETSPILQKGFSRLCFEFLFYLGLIVAIAICLFLFHFPGITTLAIEVSALIVILSLIFFIRKESKVDQQKIIAAIFLTIISVGFWALYNQTFTSLTLFADRNMVPNFMGIPVNASTMQFFNPLFIILLSPVLSILWVRLSNRQLNPTIPTKFALGILFLTAGFLILPIGTNYFSQAGLVSSSWLVWSYLFQTMGELLISPVGLAMITVLVPKRLVGLMMGVWFFAQSASFAIGGSLANLAAIPDDISNRFESLIIYGHAFIKFGIFSLILAAISFGLLPFLKRLIKE